MFADSSHGVDGFEAGASACCGARTAAVALTATMAAELLSANEGGAVANHARPCESTREELLPAEPAADTAPHVPVSTVLPTTASVERSTTKTEPGQPRVCNSSAPAEPKDATMRAAATLLIPGSTVVVVIVMLGIVMFGSATTARTAGDEIDT
jgi:hypothetical protein